MGELDSQKNRKVGGIKPQNKTERMGELDPLKNQKKKKKKTDRLGELDPKKTDRLGELDPQKTERLEDRLEEPGLYASNDN